MMVQEYIDRVFLGVDNALGEVFKSMGVSLEDLKRQPSRFHHLIFPDGRQEYRWEGRRIVWLEPMEPPAYGFKICRLRGKL